MLKLTRLLMLIAVAALVARPVMACCMVGHAQPVVSQAKVEAPSCHTDQSSSVHDQMRHEQAPQSPLDCPGCLDCDTAIMQAQSADHGMLLPQVTSQMPIIAVASRFAGFEHKPIILKTGPPDVPPDTYPTPITLKQRLLI
ncbi:MAG: hypothetical protein GYB42_07715 [Alphaproteobacteria bacterium]|nr:hypothetical protein [Alphaproteobacteria bacterium]